MVSASKFSLQSRPLRLMQADQPMTVVESAIAQVHAVLKRSRARRWLRGATRVEWWAHSRMGADPHQLHFDVNENLLRRGRGAYALQHPVRCSRTLRTTSLLRRGQRTVEVLRRSDS